MASKRTPDTVVSFKGFANGIVMSLDLDEFDFDKVIRKAVSIYKKKRAFFGENVSLYVTGFHQELSVDECGMVRKMFDYLIHKEVLAFKENRVETTNQQTIPNELEPSQEDIKIIETPPLTNKNEFLIIGKTVRAGVVVQSPGSIVVFGDIHTGGKVIAGNSLYVFGTIKGDVSFATKPSCKQAILACLQIKAVNVTVAKKPIDSNYLSASTTPVPTYIHFNDGNTEIVKMTKD
ncbi:MAG: hypothetical protein KAH01_01195 [Caldisericia bacterium]|nr:hypothetical protein [Caldisericia bacterium]